MVFAQVLILSLAVSSYSGKDSRSFQPPRAGQSREVPVRAAVEFQKAHDALGEGNSEAAIHHFRTGLSFDPSNTQARINLGILHHQMKQHEKAIENFAEAVEIDPACFRAHLNLSILLHAQRRYAESERVARKAIELQRMDVRARYMLGVSLAAQHKLVDEALENLRTAAAEFPDAHLEISRLLIEKGDFDNAVQALRMFAKTNRNFEAGVGLQLLAK